MLGTSLAAGSWLRTILKAAHRQGLWHRTFSALAINPSRRRVVLQKKSPGRYSFERPDYADITVGGHYHAGEHIEDGIREVHEELGLPVTYSDLVAGDRAGHAYAAARDWNYLSSGTFTPLSASPAAILMRRRCSRL